MGLSCRPWKVFLTSVFFIHWLLMPLIMVHLLQVQSLQLLNVITLLINELFSTVFLFLNFPSPRTYKYCFHIIRIFEQFDWFMFPFEKYFHERGASENSFFQKALFYVPFIIFLVLLRFNVCFFHIKSTRSLANW